MQRVRSGDGDGVDGLILDKRFVVRLNPANPELLCGAFCKLRIDVANGDDFALVWKRRIAGQMRKLSDAARADNADLKLFGHQRIWRELCWFAVIPCNLFRTIRRERIDSLPWMNLRRHCVVE